MNSTTSNILQRFSVIRTQKKWFHTILLVGITLAQTSFAEWEKDRPAKAPVIPPNPQKYPLVLLIGDSISGGYFPKVAKNLKDVAIVAKSTDNGESTAVGVKKLDGWIGETKWDVIHFNWGIWDMYGWQHASDDRSPAMYEKRLDELVRRMKKTSAKLVWATTTPVPPQPEQTMLRRWKKEVIINEKQELEYRNAALRVMNQHNVVINDLYAMIKPVQNEIQPKDDVHFSEKGSDMMAKQTAAVIESLLKKTNSKP